MWLLLMFRLPARSASERVKVWRALRKAGALPWKNSGYLLPNNPENLEKFQWVAAIIRKSRGEASVVEAARFSGTADRVITALFNQERARDYQRLVHDLRRKGRAEPRAVSSFHRRLAEIAAVDFFHCPRRHEAVALLHRLEAAVHRENGAGATLRGKRREYQGRVWMTRPRPHIDRVGSAWLIRRFIDPRPRFAFSADPQSRPGALRFDMFEGEFTHVGDDCTFQTLLKRFDLRDGRVRRIGEMVQAADLHHGKSANGDGSVVDAILKAWCKLGWADEEILRKGGELFDGWYASLGR